MTTDYDHTQRGVLHYLVALVGAGILVGAMLSWDNAPAFVLLIAVAGSLMFFAACFGYLRVRDLGERLEIRFGPIGMFGRSIRYDDMASAEVGRTTLLHGWGIHGLPFVGVTWNVHGYDCVRVAFKRPQGLFRFKRINIGSDDPEGLAAFLRRKM